jgi:TolB-like protein/class 3 adenylate cyclase
MARVEWEGYRHSSGEPRADGRSRQRDCRHRVRFATTATSISRIGATLGDRSRSLVGVNTSEIERKLAAILAADVAGYSRLMGSDEEGTHARLIAHRRTLVEPQIEIHKGRIVKNTGDGVLAEFASAVNAVRCAVAVQAGMVAQNAGLSEDQRIEFRIGINLGDVIVEPDDINGDGVNVAARLQTLAEVGGVCVSRGVRDQIRDKLPYALEDMGEHRVKNIARPIHAYRLRFQSKIPSNQACTPPATARLSIIVLPFANLSGDPTQDYLADGITENLTTLISRLPGTFVVGGGTAFTYRGKPVDAKQVGRDLGVRYLISGSAQRSGDRMRVNVQLIDAETGGHLWAERFDENRSDLFEIQDNIVTRLARKLSFEFIQAEGDRSIHERPTNPDAADLTLRGEVLLIRSMNPESGSWVLEEAYRLFEEALRIDDRNVVALVGLAHRYTWRAINRQSTSLAEDIRHSDELVSRALAIDPNDYWARQAKSIVLLLQKRFDEAILEADTSLALNPSGVFAYAILANLNLLLGCPDKTIEYVKTAMRLSPRDPASPIAYFHMGCAYLMLQDDHSAVEWMRKAVAQWADWAFAQYHLAAALALAGHHREAHAALAQYQKVGRLKTIDELKSEEHSDIPRYLEYRERIFEGLRQAGMPEQ